ncbi:uncharacterized protein BDR25DRAFT_358295 [Lindgomyces ingoldianus]|uniref:Uncharacterized protein n=1 Tax=Lindgomyces ingoldianus TaxID=673940 RepID=A0ACB6QKQ5_9PLEO|nr:uncharacterized protein BDR25DRAFT_358295 [Lindgomyces ingoldianus]KAF2467599.1 hypothetical protein BDR25DRAFT_358295 [Lindgomyces ingoldianus]
MFLPTKSAAKVPKSVIVTLSFLKVGASSWILIYVAFALGNLKWKSHLALGPRERESYLSPQTNHFDYWQRAPPEIID